MEKIVDKELEGKLTKNIKFLDLSNEAFTKKLFCEVDSINEKLSEDKFFLDKLSESLQKKLSSYKDKSQDIKTSADVLKLIKKGHKSNNIYKIHENFVNLETESEAYTAKATMLNAIIDLNSNQDNIIQNNHNFLIENLSNIKKNAGLIYEQMAKYDKITSNEVFKEILNLNKKLDDILYSYSVLISVYKNVLSTKSRDYILSEIYDSIKEVKMHYLYLSKKYFQSNTLTSN